MKRRWLPVLGLLIVVFALPEDPSWARRGGGGGRGGGRGGSVRRAPSGSSSVRRPASTRPSSRPATRPSSSSSGSRQANRSKVDRTRPEVSHNRASNQGSRSRDARPATRNAARPATRPATRSGGRNVARAAPSRARVPRPPPPPRPPRPRGTRAHRHVRAPLRPVPRPAMRRHHRRTWSRHAAHRRHWAFRHHYHHWHRHWHHYHWAWMWGTALTVTAFWALRPRTVVVHETVRYVDDSGKFYEPVDEGGETRYAVTTPPVDYETETLPEDAVEVYVDEQYYWYAQSTGGFYVQIAREGKTLYVVVDPPPGAFVKELPEGSIGVEEGEDEIHQYADTFFVDGENEEAEAGYLVTAPPAPESTQITELPDDTIEFEVGGTTYYYFSGATYARDAAAGADVYTIAVPEVGQTASTLPDGATALTEDGRTYFQFDTIFLESAPGGGFRVIEEPGSGEVARAPPSPLAGFPRLLVAGS